MSRRRSLSMSDYRPVADAPEANPVFQESVNAVPVLNAEPERALPPAAVLQPVDHVDQQERPHARPNDPSLYAPLSKSSSKKQDSLTETVVIVLNLALDYFYNRIDDDNLFFLLFRNGEGSRNTTVVLPLSDQNIWAMILDFESRHRGQELTLEVINQLKDQIVAYFREQYAASFQPCENRVIFKNTRIGFVAEYIPARTCTIMGGKRKSRKSKSKKSRKSRNKRI